MPTTRELVSASCAALTLACAGGAVDAPQSGSKPPIAGSYLLTTFDGNAVPGAMAEPNVRVDTGYAVFLDAGFFAVYVRATTLGGPENYISHAGHWIFSNDTLHITTPFATSTVPVRGDGTLVLEELLGTVHKLGYRRVGAPPGAYAYLFDGSPAPTFSGSLDSSGTGAARVLTIGLAVANSDVIPRVAIFNQNCVPAVYLTRDSTRLGPQIVWYDDGSGDISCFGGSRLDTIPAKGQKRYTRQYPVSLMRNSSGTPIPAGRYYVWVETELMVPQTDATVGLGWVFVAPSGQ